jgi:hypothetical protein
LTANGLQKSFRSLAELARTGSTSRLLNLAALGRAGETSVRSAHPPLMRSPGLSRALILKHRLRREDGDVADALRWRGTATKVVFPFDPSDLGLGGASLFVGQPGWSDMLAQAASAADPRDLAHDQLVLEALDELPSLDPFLVREHLRLKNLPVADGCLDLPACERERMEQFVARELVPLTGLINTEAARTEADAGSLARMLLSDRADERLGPLRETLRLAETAYAGGVYAWKGFLYYKWLLTTLTHPLQSVLTDISRLRITGRLAPDMAVRFGAVRGRVHDGVLDHCVAAHKLLGLYDAAFLSLTLEGDFRGFREFLQASPVQFLELGERIGVLSHIASFWRFRFPADIPPEAAAEDACDLLHEFDANLVQAPQYAAA